jgi:amicoumacin kinase
MNQLIRQHFNEDILRQAAARYGVPMADVNPVGGFESYVYSYVKGGKPYILKITHTFRRTVNYITGELDWLSFLAQGGMSVAEAVESIHGNWVEIIAVPNSTHQFLVISYVMAPGQLISEAEWNSTTFTRWGQLMGKMHARTKHYAIRHPDAQRRTHIEDALIDVSGMTEMPSQICATSNQLFQRLSHLPQSTDVYGLVHSDLHQGNLFIQDGQLTAIDFDDCSYTWFANDIAIALYYALWTPKRQVTDKVAFAKEYLTSFLHGYEHELTFDSSWLQHFPDFLQLRHLILYAVLHRSWDASRLNERQKEILNQYSEDLLNNRPVIDFDFSTL